MIDQYTADHTGWARFSDDMTMRYRLGRSLTGEPIETIPRSMTAVFALLNPSTADAFVPDPTATRAVSFARMFGAGAVEIVNINAWRATDPAEIYKLAFGFRGDDATNDYQLVEACTGAMIVIAGWGTHGALDHRGVAVRRLLAGGGVKLYHLGLTKHGHPRHPLYLRGDTAPQEWRSEIAKALFQKLRRLNTENGGRDGDE